MGISTDVLHDFAAKEIKSIYPGFYGWKITPRKTGNGYYTAIVLERSGDRLRSLSGFSSRPEDHALWHLEKLTTSETYPDDLLSRKEYAVMVPANAIYPCSGWDKSFHREIFCLRW
jgi:hypothetical protein